MVCADRRAKGLCLPSTVIEFYVTHLQVLQKQQDRDDKVRGLWETVLDTLDFMKQADPLKEIEGLERTVQSIMKLIYDCALFLRGYGEQGFISTCLFCSGSFLLA